MRLDGVLQYLHRAYLPNGELLATIEGKVPLLQPISWKPYGTCGVLRCRSKCNYEILDASGFQRKMTTGIFKNALRENGDLAGVFEFYGKTGYFYLCDLKVKNENKMVTGIRLFSGESTFSLNDEDITIQWDNTQEKVGLFIRGYLWATINPVIKYRTHHAA